MRRIIASNRRRFKASETPAVIVENAAMYAIKRLDAVETGLDFAQI